MEWQLRRGNAQHSTLHIATQQAYPRAGLEVFNQYAVRFILGVRYNASSAYPPLQDLSNAQLFSTFGFTTKQNPHDSVLVRLPTPSISSQRFHDTPLHAGLNTYDMAVAADSLRSGLLASFQDSIQASDECLTQHGISVPLMNTARILSLAERDLTEAGLQRFLAMNSAAAAPSAPYSVRRLAEHGVAALGGPSFVNRFTRIVHSYFTRQAPSAEAPAIPDALQVSFGRLSQREAADLIVPPRVELTACRLLHRALLQLLARLDSASSTRAADSALTELQGVVSPESSLSVSAAGDVDEDDWHSVHTVAVEVVNQVLHALTHRGALSPAQLQTAHALRLRLSEEAMLVHSIRQLEAIIRSGLLEQAQDSFEQYDVAELAQPLHR